MYCKNSTQNNDFERTNIALMEKNICNVELEFVVVCLLYEIPRRSAA